MRGVVLATDGHGMGRHIGQSVHGDKRANAERCGRQTSRARGKPVSNYGDDVEQTTTSAQAAVNQAYRDTFSHDYDPNTVHVGGSCDYP